MSIGIIGCGSLGQSLARRYAINFPVVVSAASEVSRAKLQQWWSVKDNRTVAQSHQVILSVKPAQAEHVCAELKGKIPETTVIVSAVAALSCERLIDWLGHRKIIRIMPTILGGGPIAVYNPTELPLVLPDREILFNDQQEFDLATVVSGCFPGILSHTLDSWISAAVKLGMSRERAKQLIMGNMQFMQGDQDLKALIRQVATKGGATEAGILALGNIETWLYEALYAADRRLDAYRDY